MPSYDGLTKHDRIKRDWRICPRCNVKAVNKENRCCMACKGKLIWYGDDANDFNETMTWWYMWYKPPFGPEAYYDKSFFRDNILS